MDHNRKQPHRLKYQKIERIQNSKNSLDQLSCGAVVGNEITNRLFFVIGTSIQFQNTRIIQNTQHPSIVLLYIQLTCDIPDLQRRFVRIIHTHP